MVQRVCETCSLDGFKQTRLHHQSSNDYFMTVYQPGRSWSSILLHEFVMHKQMVDLQTYFKRKSKKSFVTSSSRSLSLRLLICYFGSSQGIPHLPCHKPLTDYDASSNFCSFHNSKLLQ